MSQLHTKDGEAAVAFGTTRTGFGAFPRHPQSGRDWRSVQTLERFYSTTWTSPTRFQLTAFDRTFRAYFVRYGVETALESGRGAGCFGLAVSFPGRFPSSLLAIREKAFNTTFERLADKGNVLQRLPSGKVCVACESFDRVAHELTAELDHLLRLVSTFLYPYTWASPPSTSDRITQAGTQTPDEPALEVLRTLGALEFRDDLPPLPYQDERSPSRSGDQSSVAADDHTSGASRDVLQTLEPADSLFESLKRDISDLRFQIDSALGTLDRVQADLHTLQLRVLSSRSGQPAPPRAEGTQKNPMSLSRPTAAKANTGTRTSRLFIVAIGALAVIALITTLLQFFCQGQLRAVPEPASPVAAHK